MSCFRIRSEKGDAFADSVESYLSSKVEITSIAKNGTEHTHPHFVGLLRSNNSQASKFVRFAPDGVCLTTSQRVFHWEAKNSIYIEKDAYETYLKYYQMGCQVIVFVNDKSNRVHWQFVEKIGFIPSEMEVEKFPLSRRFPIDEDGWICPRKSGRRAGTGSGTPYKCIDLDSMILVDDFYTGDAP